MSRVARAIALAREEGMAEVLAGVAGLALVMLLTTPALGTFPGALIPWPAHGIALALLLAAPRGRRREAAVLLALGVFLASGVNALRIEGTFARALGAAMLLVSQSIFALLLYDRMAKGASPLSGTISCALALAAAVFGTAPMPIAGELAMELYGRDVAPLFTGWTWWTASASSGAALLGSTLVLLGRTPHEAPARPLLSVEFATLGVIYALALQSAFIERGPFPQLVPPALAALPFLVWAGLRFGVRGYGVISAFLIVVAVGTTWADIGPFARFEMDKIDRLRRAWVYVASLVGPALLFPVTIAQRRDSERRAREALAQLSAILEGTGDLISAVDRDLRLLAANTAWYEVYERFNGARLVPGMSVVEHSRLEPAELARSRQLWARALGGERFTVVREADDLDGRRGEFEITYAPVRDAAGTVIGASQVIRDVTERRGREAEAAESRRLESVGRLAGGVAHDFNNLMTVVMGYAEILRGSLEPGDERARDLGEIERAAARAGELTQQLLAFARQRRSTPADLDPGVVVEGLGRLIAPLLGPTVDFEVHAKPDLHLVRMDPAQFEQVVLNLAVNARDAMRGGGRLVIECANAERAGRHGVLLTVTDTGHGMTPDVQARIFEPFYTTKPVGEGTGLGLATVHGIVHGAGGRIDVATAPGVGSRFSVFLPAIDPPGDPTDTPAVRPAAPPAPAPAPGPRTP
jgi:PAS domain S-box-containing protein